jgi:hypothetical protein
MTVPAHVHNDPHASVEPYEDTLGDSANYSLYGYPTPPGGRGSPSGNIADIDHKSSFLELFQHTANYTAEYASDEANGEDASSIPSVGLHRPDLVVSDPGVPEDIDIGEITVQADDLIPFAMKRTAAFYRFFYSLFDVTPPSLSLTFPTSSVPASPDYSKTTSVMLTASGSDPESGIEISGYRYSYMYWTGSAWSAEYYIGSSSTTNSAVFSATDNRIYAFFVTASNGGGAQRTVGPGYLFVDATLPSNPSSPATELHGMTSNVWQGTINVASFTWSGAADTGGSGVKGYSVYWGTDSSGEPGTTFEQVGAFLNPGAFTGTYYLRVRTFDNAGNYSAPITLFIAKYSGSGTPPDNLLGQVQGVSSITWSWGSVAGATEYRFYPSTAIVYTPVAGLNITQTALSTNTSYGASVSAFVGGAETSLTGPLLVYTLAAPPTGYGLVSVQDTSLMVKWGANGNPAGTQYRLDYWTAGGSTTSVQVGVTSATVNGLSAATTYYLRVNAKNGDGLLTPSSNTVITGTLPPPPDNIIGTALGVSSITWAWSDVAGAIQYKFYPSTGGAAITRVASNWTQIGLSINTAYGGRVSAVNSGGESALTDTATTYTFAAPPIAQIVTSVGISSATVVWGASQNPSSTYFTLQASPDSFTSISESSRTFRSTATLTSLLPNTSWYFRVKAENGQGTFTTYAATVSTVTYASVPTALTLTQASSSSVAAIWGRNLNPTDTQFELSFSSTNFITNISTPLPFSDASAVTQVNVSGLAAETTYYARIRARNRLGRVTGFAYISYFLPSNLIQSVDPSVLTTIVFGNASLTIPAHAFTQVITLTMQPPGPLPADTCLVATLSGINSGVEIIPDKSIVPTKNLTLTLSYTAAQAAGRNESQFVIARYEPARAAWVPYPSTPNPAANSVTAQIDHLSLFQVMQVSPAGSLSSAVLKVFPNPVHLSRGQTMKFAGLPAGASVKIYTFQGELVRELSADESGMLLWDGQNSSGQTVASEIYLALIKSGKDTKTLKVMVER